MEGPVVGGFRRRRPGPCIRNLLKMGAIGSSGILVPRVSMQNKMVEVPAMLKEEAITSHFGTRLRRSRCWVYGVHSARQPSRRWPRWRGQVGTCTRSVSSDPKFLLLAACLLFGWQDVHDWHVYTVAAVQMQACIPIASSIMTLVPGQD